MFWSSAGASSNIDQVLDDPTVTLQTILEQEEVLQELRALNKKLVEFLCRPESLHGMVDLITTQPPQDVPLAAQYKLPNVAAEVLTSDNNFVEKITGDKTLLGKLCHYFRSNPSPINPLLASYVCRVLSEIITRKLDQNWYSYQLNLIQTMSYLQGEAGVLSWFLSHLDCSAVCEFFYKLIMNVEGPDMRASLYEWLVERERIIHRIVEKMSRKELEDVHANVSRLIGDLLYGFQDEMVNYSQDRACDADPFLQILRSHDTICTLLNVLFSPDSICETSIVHGLDLLLSLLGVTRRSPRQSGRNDSLDENNEGIILSEAIKTELLSRMGTLLTLLQSPCDQNPLPMTYGLLESPVGLGRLAIAKFIAHLFTLNDDELNMGMISSGVLKQLLDLFWTNPWNNFLHRYVCKILTCIAKASAVSPASVSYLVKDMQLLSKILEVFENKELKVGYRGHLAKVASVWGEAQENQEGLKQLMESDNKEFLAKWDTFCADTLENYLSSEKILLAGVHPPASGGMLSSSNAHGGDSYDSESILSSGFRISGSESRSESRQWMDSAGAQSMFNINFDAADSLLNLTIGGLGTDEDGKANRSLFELFCDRKISSYEGDDDEEDNEIVRKKSFDLGSPDSDSNDSLEGDDDEKEAREKKDSFLGGLELTPSSTLDDPEEDDIFSRANIKTLDEDVPPPPVVAALGPDPWSNQLLPGMPSTGDESWCDPNLIFGIGSDSSGAEAGANDSSNGDWAKFDAKGGSSEEWADFQSPISKEQDNNPTETEAQTEMEHNSTSCGSNIVSSEDVQQFQSTSAKDETVSASQQVSATN